MLKIKKKIRSRRISMPKSKGPLEEITQEQHDLLIERYFMLATKVQKSAKPKLVYEVSCFTCQRKGWVESPGRKALKEAHIHAGLVIQGWVIGPRGFQCPECYGADINAMVETADAAAGFTIEAEPLPQKVDFYVGDIAPFALYNDIVSMARGRGIEVVAVERMALSSLTLAMLNDFATREDAQWVFKISAKTEREALDIARELLEDAADKE
jgi:hypothetical protein